MEQDLVNYIRDAKAHGLSDIEIKQNLLNAGWEAASVDDSFTHFKALENKPVSNKDEELSLHHTFSAIEQKPLVDHHTPGKTDLNPTLNPSVTISEQHFQTQTKKPLFKKASTWVGLVLLIILGVASYGYFVLGYYNPGKLWQKFVSGEKGRIYNTNFSFTISGSEGRGGENVELGISGNGYINGANMDAAQVSLDLTGSVASSEMNISKNTKIVFLNNVLYLNFGKLPELYNYLDKPDAEWVKLDLKKFEEYANNMAGQEGNKFKELLPKYEKELKEVWEENEVIKGTKILGNETISGVLTFHLKNEVDKEVLIENINKSIDIIAKFGEESTGQTLTDSDRQEAQELKTSIAKFINSIQVNQFETWIGLTDSQLYKIVFDSNIKIEEMLPGSFDEINPLTSARSKSRDAKRLADMRQMASALELYFNDNSGYPAGENGVPLGITPMYIGIVPTAPIPPDGNCTDYYNTYWYKHAGQPTTFNGKTVYSNYELTFCLGNTTGGYGAGIARMTPAGLESSVPCPTNSEECFSENPSTTEEIPDIKFKMDLNYSDYGKTQEVTAPENAVDLLEILMGALGTAQGLSRDAKRIADVRQFASALELYFNDKGEYPNSINDVAPTYFGVIPTAPEADGTCSQEDNTYTYRRLTNNKYQLTFCLGEATGGYAPGIHTLSEAGIN